jgi:protein involved in polysaccharide export with SLBB domain
LRFKRAMKNSCQLFTSISKFIRCSIFLGLLCAIPGIAQQGAVPDRYGSAEPVKSRADRAADDLVSLSPDKIISLLRAESGLFLQVKKALVRKAFEQGRLLDPQDLTDDAVFSLIREDENVRVLVTREIEDRSYVRAKPTREELARGLVSEPLRGQAKTAPAGSDQTKLTQEEVYWAEHEGGEERYPERYQSPQNPQQAPAAPPSYNVPEQPGDQSPFGPNPEEILPQEPGVGDRRRQLERTQAPLQGDYPDVLQAGSMGMPSISPDGLPQLLSTSNSQQSMSSAMRGMGQSGAGASIPEERSLMPSDQWPDQSALSGRDQYPEQASNQTLPQSVNRQPRLLPHRPQQPALRHTPNPYADVPSLYDLYSQYSARPAILQRFGSEIFHNGTGNLERLPMDMPVGPEYVLGPGDGLTIQLWGGVSQRLVRVVDRQGRVALPETGALEVAGKSLGEVQHLVQTALQTEFRDVQADVSLSRLHSVRIFVVGDVERPGAYDVSSLSTPLNAVFMAGGPTSAGSLRIIEHRRGTQLLQTTDVYDLLLHGVRSDLKGLQAGDTVRVPPLGAEVTIEGMVRRPAIYELDGEKNLTQVLELAGGVLQSGTLRHVDVERTEAHQSRSMLRLDIPEDNNKDAVTQALNSFFIQDGDKVKITPILPYADKTVYLEGHVFRPGKFAYQDGMKVTDIIHSYNELLPEPYKRHAEIIRLNAPDYTPQVLAFNLENALAGKDQDLVLKPFDTIRVFGRFDFEDQPVVTVAGEVRDPGDHVTNGVTYLRDAVYLAGGATIDAQLSDAQVFRKTDDGKLEVLSVNLSKALSGDPKDNILLQPSDRLFIHKDISRSDPPTVLAEGEVARPGKYPLGDNMTAAELVRLAGGLKRGAYTQEADLTRYDILQGTQISSEVIPVPIAKAMANEPDADVRLHNGDVLTIRQVAGWNDLEATIAVQGEVVHPGTYGILEGERLSSVIARAGGFRPDAYPYGSIFQRVQVLELEKKNRAQLISEMQDQGLSLRQVSDSDADQRASKEATLQQWQTTLDQLRNIPPAGRLVLHISANTQRWVNTSSDIQLRAGDSIFIPKRPNAVMVDGSVYNPTAVTFKPGKDAGWYLQQAGGPTTMANKKAIFVVRADGSVVGGSGGIFSGGVEKAALQPGDLVMVPQKAFTTNRRLESTVQVAQIATAIGIAIQVARSF